MPTHMLRLPPVHDPQRYAGLYVFDFGTHVSVGYTAAEIALLCTHPDYREGKAYQIYRVTEEGGFELRGVRESTLLSGDATVFLRADPARARADYSALRAAAQREPPPSAIELVLAKGYQFDPPELTALLCSASAADLTAGWLSRIDFRGGDDVLVGPQVRAAIDSLDGLRLSSCVLAGIGEIADRSSEEVLRRVGDAVQR